MGKTTKLHEIMKHDGDFEVVRLGNDRYRIGYCSRCGACCRTVNMDTKGSQIAIDWLKLHGVKVSKIGDIKKDPREEAVEFTLSLSFPCVCKELTVDAMGHHHKCNIYEDRPIICKMYPKHNAGDGTCTYVFINTKELEVFSHEYQKYWREQHGKEKTITIIQ